MVAVTRREGLSKGPGVSPSPFHPKPTCPLVTWPLTMLLGEEEPVPRVHTAGPHAALAATAQPPQLQATAALTRPGACARLLTPPEKGFLDAASLGWIQESSSAARSRGTSSFV